MSEEWMEGGDLNPEEIVAELDRYVIAQEDAKRAVAIALRNRWRRLRVPAEIQEEITPKNIIMIGPTGVGKTEISRRLAKLARAPFIKVEATKFTEVGYVGRDVDSIIRDLTEIAHNLVKEEERTGVLAKAEAMAEERLLDALLPTTLGESDRAAGELKNSTREKLRQQLRDGRLEERSIEIEIQKQVSAHLELLSPMGMAEIEGQLKDLFTNLIPRGRERRKQTVAEARRILIAEAQEGLIDGERVAHQAVRRVENTGIVFIDEIDKVAGRRADSRGPDVSREGVQRDLLPLVEGSTVSTKYGPVRTDHILFIASGAFHMSKPSDLMPEFQGRFPIRVELKSLAAEHFVRILTEPRNALTKQYAELLRTEEVEISFTPDGIREIAELTAQVNSRMEDIGARRLSTLLERLLEDVSFTAHRRRGDRVTIDSEYVRRKLAGVIQDANLSHYIL